MATRKNLISIDELLNKKFKTIPFVGRFRELIGEPEDNGTWFIKGKSGHGKTTFLVQLITELTKYGKVIYNSLEEGARLSMQEVFKEQNLDKSIRSKIKMGHRIPMSELMLKIKKSRGIKFCVIDSIQYTFMTAKDYKAMQAENPKIVFIINSHQKGLLAKGQLAQDIEFDADVKIDVEGYKAISRSRASRGIVTKPYIIWEEGAQQYWNDLKL